MPLLCANYFINTSTKIKVNSDDTTVTGSTSGIAQGVSEIDTNDTKQMAQSLLDNMMLFTMANISGKALWVHVGFEIVVTSLVLFFGKSITAKLEWQNIMCSTCSNCIFLEL